jgi:hypothetical protein
MAHSSINPCTPRGLFVPAIFLQNSFRTAFLEALIKLQKRQILDFLRFH